MSDKTFHPSGVARRDFLKLGSLAVAGVAGAGFPSFAFGALRKLPASLLSPGYAAAEPEEGAIEWLTPAERLLSGDPAFISRDARVTVRSSSRAASQNGKIGGAAIDVVFPALGYQPESYPTYRAWTFRQDQYTYGASAGVSFRVPIEATSGLPLLFTRLKTSAVSETAPSGVPVPDEMLRLSLGSASNAPKLRRGIYVIAYGEDGARGVTNWSTVPITRRGNDIVVPDAQFSYVVLKIDYAD